MGTRGNMDRFLQAKDLLSFVTVCPIEFKEKKYENVTTKEEDAGYGTKATVIAEAKGKAMYRGDIACGPFCLTVIRRIKDSTNYVRIFVEGCKLLWEDNWRRKVHEMDSGEWRRNPTIIYRINYLNSSVVFFRWENMDVTPRGKETLLHLAACVRIKYTHILLFR